MALIQATNFLRAFRTLREASALGLLISCEEEEKKADLGKLIQNWNRFVLQQLHQVKARVVWLSLLPAASLLGDAAIMC